MPLEQKVQGDQNNGKENKLASMEWCSGAIQLLSYLHGFPCRQIRVEMTGSDQSVDFTAVDLKVDSVHAVHPVVTTPFKACYR